MSTEAQVNEGQAPQQAAAPASRRWSQAQKAALEELYKKHNHLRFHGGAEGALVALQRSHPEQFQDQTVQRVQQWFKTRRKNHNKQIRLQEDAAEGRTYGDTDIPEPADAMLPHEEDQEAGEAQIGEPHQQAAVMQGDGLGQQTMHAQSSGAGQPAQLSAEDFIGRSSKRHRKHTSEYKMRQSLLRKVDNYVSKARGKTEVALCIASSSQKETMWVHGRGMAMSSSVRRGAMGKLFKDLIDKKREDVENGVQSEGEEEEGGGGVRQGNYSHATPAYLAFFCACERPVREELRARRRTASQQFVSQLCAKLWHTLTPEDRNLITSGTSLQLILTCHPSLWDEGMQTSSTAPLQSF